MTAWANAKRDPALGDPKLRKMMAKLKPKGPIWKIARSERRYGGILIVQVSEAWPYGPPIYTKEFGRWNCWGFR